MYAFVYTTPTSDAAAGGSGSGSGAGSDVDNDSLFERLDQDAGANSVQQLTPKKDTASPEASKNHPNQKLLVAGWMMKQGGKWHTWKKRYFANSLDQPLLLCYYTDKEKRTIKGSVNVATALAFQVAKQGNANKTGYQVTTPNRVFRFVAVGDEDASYWEDSFGKLLCEVEKNHPVMWNRPAKYGKNHQKKKQQEVPVKRKSHHSGGGAAPAVQPTAAAAPADVKTASPLQGNSTAVASEAIEVPVIEEAVTEETTSSSATAAAGWSSASNVTANAETGSTTKTNLDTGSSTSNATGTTNDSRAPATEETPAVDAKQ
eukprot:TRINITY_DN1543_c0_g1_i1.p1 TRINITY_DN1543_c0_g1~~TRINITY_DN1543_c0_g1_i1.p1  ORF type:complete len:317 (+),score=115.64 TRINITY_DN1543_c0_g1_i1:95-1045(+)